MLWQRPENYSYTTWFKTKNKFTALIIKYHINLIHSKKGKVENSCRVEVKKKVQVQETRHMNLCRIEITLWTVPAADIAIRMQKTTWTQKCKDILNPEFSNLDSRYLIDILRRLSEGVAIWIQFNDITDRKGLWLEIQVKKAKNLTSPNLVWKLLPNTVFSRLPTDAHCTMLLWTTCCYSFPKLLL